MAGLGSLLLLVCYCTQAVYAAHPPLTCKGRYLGCYKDGVPAPGVPPVRVVNTVLDAGPVATMTVDGCAAACAASVSEEGAVCMAGC